MPNRYLYYSYHGVKTLKILVFILALFPITISLFSINLWKNFCWLCQYVSVLIRENKERIVTIIGSKSESPQNTPDLAWCPNQIIESQRVEIQDSVSTWHCVLLFGGENNIYIILSAQKLCCRHDRMLISIFSTQK